MKTKSKRCRFETAHDNFVLYWNPAHAWILLMAYLGLAYNLKVGCASRHCQSCLGGASSHICSIIAMSCHRMAAGIVMRLRSPPLCVAGEEKDPEKAISELKKAAVFSKITRIVFGFASCPTRMYRFEQVGGFHYKYRFKRATADVSTPCTSRHGAGRGRRGTRGAGGGPCIRASLFRDGTLEEREGCKADPDSEGPCRSKRSTRRTRTSARRRSRRT